MLYWISIFSYIIKDNGVDSTVDGVVPYGYDYSCDSAEGKCK